MERLVEALSPDRDPSRNPLVQAMFSFHDSAVPDVEFGGLSGEVLELHNGSAKVDLGVVVLPKAEQRIGRAPRPEDESITLIWEYATDLFDHSTMRRMVGHYLTLLAAAVGSTGSAVTRLPMLSPEEDPAARPAPGPAPDPAVAESPAAAEKAAVAEPPATPTERIVADVWCEVLELPAVGVLDNFFDLGGHSMLLYRMRERLAATAGASLAIIEFFEHPTVRALARRIDGDARTDASDAPGAPDVSDRSRGRSRLELRRVRRALIADSGQSGAGS
jgi:hypothetical protein